MTERERYDKLLETVTILRERFERDIQWLVDFSTHHPEASLEDLLEHLGKIRDHYTRLDILVRDAIREYYGVEQR